MRPAIHPDGDFLLFLIDVTVVRDDALRVAIDVGPEAHLREDRFERIVPGVRPARPLRYVEVLRRPAVGSPARLAADWKTGGVADHPAPILVARQRPPESGEVVLRQCSIGAEQYKYEPRRHEGTEQYFFLHSVPSV